MPTEEEVRSALEGIEVGTEVQVELADGRQVSGTYAGSDAGRVVLDDVDPDTVELGEEDGIDLADVERVSTFITSEGPE